MRLWLANLLYRVADRLDPDTERVRREAFQRALLATALELELQRERAERPTTYTRRVRAIR